MVFVEVAAVAFAYDGLNVLVEFVDPKADCV